MKKLRGLIVDDSKFMQEVLSAILNCDDEIEIIGVADNGKDAIDKVGALNPDFVTMDITMPVMDGLEAIGHIMDRHPLPIMVITDIKDAKVAFNALSLGALEIFPKSDVQPEKADLLIRKIKILAKVIVIRHMKKRTAEPRQQISRAADTPNTFQKVVAIASSTGGPKALSDILSTLPADFPFPIVIAQHIENTFVANLVDWMKHTSPLTIKIGAANEKLAPGTVYISPTDKNMVIDPSGKINFTELEPTDIYHPSCNKLLSSVGVAFGVNSIGVVLTGMGNDGKEGIKTIKINGGITIAQDEASSIVYGMPKEAIDSGSVDTVLGLEHISRHLIGLARPYSNHKTGSA